MSNVFLDEYTKNMESIKALYLEDASIHSRHLAVLSHYCQTFPTRSKNALSVVEEAIAGVFEYIHAMGSDIAGLEAGLIAEAILKVLRLSDEEKVRVADTIRADVYLAGPDMLKELRHPLSGVTNVIQAQNALKDAEAKKHAYRKKPVVISAYQFTEADMMPAAVDKWPSWLREACVLTSDLVGAFAIHPAQNSAGGCPASIVTLEGKMNGKFTDWIIQGVKGELYFCDNEIFQATYDKV